MSASAIELSGYAALSGATYADFTDLSASGVADALVTQLNFTRTQADDFSTTWEVLSQQSNTLSGFSAALFRNRLTGETVFAIAGTEFGEQGILFKGIVNAGKIIFDCCKETR